MMKTHSGGCHCGAVRYQVDVDLAEPVSRCNCSFCTKTGGTGVVVKPSAFQLLSGEDKLTDYGREGVPIRHPFCRLCGIRTFNTGHLPELGGDYVAVHVNTLDHFDISELKLLYWDGRHNNWEAGPRDTPWPVRASA
jgi:hypothetical protein